LTGVVGAVVVALLLLIAPNLLQHLPAAALAAVVIASAIGLFEAGIAGDVVIAFDALGSAEHCRVRTPAIPQEFDNSDYDR
jgi:hypothetical protein